MTRAVDATFRPTRWLIFTQYYPPELGAPQVRLQAMARQLSAHGIDVEVLTAMPNYPTGRVQEGYRGRWYMREQLDAIPVRRTWVFAGAGRSALIRIANYLSFTITGFVAALFGPKPDVLFVEAQPLSLGVAALILKWCRGIPYIYNVPDLQVEVARELGFIRNRRVLQFMTLVERIVATRAWKVSTVTHGFIEHFRRQGVSPGQLTFLPNGADSDFLAPVTPCEQLLDRWRLRGRHVFLYVGTHAYYHGLEVVIDAAERLRDRHDIVILMIGQGPERQRLIQQAAERRLENIVFDDSPYAERRQLYSIACASLSTFRDIEVASLMRPAKVFPSLSCGVPVVYVGRGEGADLIRDHGCGVVVPPGDAAALAEAMTALAADPHARTRMGAAGRALIEREYAWSTVVSRWLAELGLPRTAVSPIAQVDPVLQEDHV